MLSIFARNLVGQFYSKATSKAARQPHRLVCKRPAASAATFLAPTEQATSHLAELLAADRAAKDCLCLYGKVGAGKSVFSRAYIRAVAEDELLPVPSPTYLLQNCYDFEEGPPVHHFDLYRLEGNVGLERLDLETSFQTAVSLVEWADRLVDHTPAERLSISLELLLPEEKASLEAAGLGPRPSEAEDGDEEEGAYADRRWRRIHIQAHGRRWEQALPNLVQAVDNDHQIGGLLHLTSSHIESLTAAD